MVEKGNRLNMGVEFKNDSFICPGLILWSLAVILFYSIIFGGYNDHITSIVVNPLVTLTGWLFVATHFVTGGCHRWPTGEGKVVEYKYVICDNNGAGARDLRIPKRKQRSEPCHPSMADGDPWGHGSGLWCFSVVDLVLLVFLLLENVQCHMMSHGNENRHWNWDVSQGLKSENPKPFLQPSLKKCRPLIIGQKYRSIFSICLVVPVPVLSFCSVFNHLVVYVTVVQSYPISHRIHVWYIYIC